MRDSRSRNRLVLLNVSKFFDTMSSQTRLFVGNLPENTKEEDIQKVFSTFGNITHLDLKSKSAGDKASKSFAFITLSTSVQNIESCLKHFSNNDFKGTKLYVTRARESFLERLQRERAEAQQKPVELDHNPKANPIIKLSEKLNPRKRAIDKPVETENKQKKHASRTPPSNVLYEGDISKSAPSPDKKKQDSDQKRMESMKKKRQEFKQKQTIIKHSLIGVDNVQNKKTVFSDDEDFVPNASTRTFTDSFVDDTQQKARRLFDDDEEDDDSVNFKIKEQFEGKKGQKVLDLQSRYKSDKRFVLDERFVEDEQSEEELTAQCAEDNNVDLQQIDEKTKQLNILQDVLGVSIKTKSSEPANNKKTKSKMGMLRFDPLQPEHAKFLAPVEEKQEPVKTSKKKKSKEKQQEIEKPLENPPTADTPIVSKEQFYKVSETLKEAIVQPTTFSLRSLFGTNNDTAKDDTDEKQIDYIPLEPPKKQKKKNPLEPGEKNPFVYDSSDSEAEETEAVEQVDPTPRAAEPKHVWQENLFFSHSDQRLKEGLQFFLNTNGSEGQKERRELKSLMKKRIYNKERKNQMFQKKIGGNKRRPMKKNFRKKV